MTPVNYDPPISMGDHSLEALTPPSLLAIYETRNCGFQIANFFSSFRGVPLLRRVREPQHVSSCGGLIKDKLFNMTIIDHSIISVTVTVVTITLSQSLCGSHTP